MDRFTETPPQKLSNQELTKKYEAFKAYFKYANEGYSHNLALAHMYEREMNRRGLARQAKPATLETEKESGE